MKTSKITKEQEHSGKEHTSTQSVANTQMLNKKTQMARIITYLSK
jgi:hypothetical protein